jgi:IS30 family transposase
MGYTHLSITERSQLEILDRLVWSSREIGKELGRHHSAIARELKRGSRSGMYMAETAQATYTERRVSYKPTGCFTPELAGELEEKLQETWSPEQIAEERRASGKTFVCFKTIYR